MQRWVFVAGFTLVSLVSLGVYAQPEGRVFNNTPDTVAIWEFNNLGLPGDVVNDGTVVSDLSGNGLDAVVENAGGNLVVGAGDENFGDTDTTLYTTGQGPRVVADYPDEFTYDETQSFTMELYVKRDETAGNQAWGMLAGTWHSRTANGVCDDGCDGTCRNAEGAWYGWGLMRHSGDNESFTFNMSPVNTDGTLLSRGCCNERHPGAVVTFPHDEFAYFVGSIDREEQIARFFMSTIEGGTQEVGSVGLQDGWSFITPTDPVEHDSQRFIMFAGEDDRSCGVYRNGPTGYHLNAVRISTAPMDFFDVEDAWFAIQDGEATPPSEGDGCQALLSVSKTTALTGECVELSASNSTVEGGTIEKYEWKIGDGDFTEGEETLEMTFDDTGDVEVMLRITTSNGCESTARSSIAVRLADVSTEILARDGLEPLLGPLVRVPAGTVLTLDSGASGTVIPAGVYSCPIADQTPLDPTPVASYAWDLDGDGNPENTESSFDTAPLSEGSFTVVLTVTNEDGASGEARLDVVVLPNRPGAERIFGDTPDTLGIWEFNNLEEEGLVVGDALPDGFVIPDVSGNGLNAEVEGNNGELVVAEGDPNYTGEFGDNLMVQKAAAAGPPRVVVNDEEAFTFDELQSFTMELYVHRAENAGNEAWGMLAGTWHSRNSGADLCIDAQGVEDCGCRNTEGVWYGWGLMRHSGDNDAFTFNLSPINPDGTYNSQGCCNEQNPGPVIRFEQGYNYFAATIDREAQQARYYVNGAQVASTTLQPDWSFITPTDHDPQRFAMFTGEDDRSCNAYRGGPSGYSIDAARVQTAAVTTEQVETTWADILNATTSPAPEVTEASLKPGDVNGDRSYNISDPVAELGYLFSSEPLPACYTVAGTNPPQLTSSGLAILDHNGDGAANIADAVASLSWLFGGGTPPALGEDCALLEGDCESNCP